MKTILVRYLGDFFNPPGPAAVLKPITGLTSLGRRNCFNGDRRRDRKLERRRNVKHTDTTTKATNAALPTHMPTINGVDPEQKKNLHTREATK